MSFDISDLSERLHLLPSGMFIVSNELSAVSYSLCELTVTSKALDDAASTLLHACAGISVSGSYMGCFREASCAASNRMQASLAVNVPDMTVKKCLDLALMAGWTYGGLAPGTTPGTTSCYGGDKLSPTTVNPGCFAACAGNSSERCGDNNCMVSVYSGEVCLLNSAAARETCCKAAAYSCCCVGIEKHTTTTPRQYTFCIRGQRWHDSLLKSSSCSLLCRVMCISSR